MKINRIILWIIAILLTPGLLHAEQQTPVSYRVLFVNQSIELPPWVLSMFVQCREEFEHLSGASVGMAIEKLDDTGSGKWSEINNNSHLPEQEGDIDFMVYRNPVSPPPLHLAAEVGVPLVIPACDTAWIQRADQVPPNVHITTITLSPIRTARLATQLFPDTRKLIVIGGSHPTDRFLIQRAREEMGDRWEGMAVEYWEGIMPAELQRRTAALPDDHAVLFLKVARDPSGAIHISRDVVRDLVACSPVPIFGIADHFLEEGVVGGYVVSSELEGRRGGQMLAQLAAGKPLPALAYVEDYGEYQFNWKAMQRWGIRESRLPPGSQILYRPERIFDRHPWMQHSLWGLMVALALIFCASLLFLRKRRQIFQKLLKNEAWVKLSTEKAGIALWEYDLVQNRMARSENHDQLYGMEPQPIWTAEMFLDALHPDDRDFAMQTIDQAIAIGGPEGYRFDYRTVWPDGTLHWLLLDGEISERDAEGTATRMRGCLIDITDRKLVEEELRESEREARLVADLLTNSNQPVGVGFADGRLGRLNPAFCELTGYTEEELHAIDWATELTPPEWLPTEREALAELERTGEPVRYEKEYIRKDGTRVPIELFVHLHRDQDSEPEYYFAFITDITTRKQTENALKTSEETVRRKLKAITEPESDLSDLELSDLIDVDGIRSLMEDFYEVTGILSAIVDLQGNVLFGVGWQDICTQFHRVHPETAQHCFESDTILSQGASGNFKAYRCKNNMWDMASPIEIAGQHVGNLFFGQFFYDDEKVDTDAFRKQAHQYGFDEEKYLDALNRVPRFNRETVNKAMSFYAKLAGILSKQSYSNIQLSRTLAESKRTEEALRESEERLREAQRTAQIAHWNFDPETGNTEWSEQMYDILGLDPANGPPNLAEHQTFIHPDDWEEFEATVQQAVEHGTPYDIILRIQHPDGTKRFINAIGTPITDEAGAVIELRGTIQDITERKQAEEALLSSERQYRNVIQTTSDGFWRIDRNLRLLEVNAAYCDMSGYSEQELLRMSIPDLDAIESPADSRARAEGIFEEGTGRFETRHRRKDGSEYDVEIITESDPDHEQFFVFIRDITERKQAQARLQMVNDAMENSLNAFDIINADGGFSYVNKSYVEMWGYDSADEIIGTSPSGHCLDPEQPRKIIESIRNTGTFQEEFTAKRKDGSTFEVLMCARKSVDPDGNEIFPTSSIDITELKRAREELRREKDRLQLALEVVEMGAWDLNLIDHSSHRTSRHDQIFGYDSPLDEWTYEMFLEHVVPEDREEVNRKFSAAVANQSDWDFECRIRHRTDGELRWISAVGRHGEPVEGTVQTMTGTVLDITERKRIENRLKENEEKLRRMFEQAPMPICMNGFDGAFLSANPAYEKLTGYTEDELQNMTFFDITHPDDRPINKDHLKYISIGQAPTFEMEKRYLCKDGSEIIVMVHATAVHDAEGTPLFGLAVVEDVTELKRAKQALLESHTQLEQRVEERTTELKKRKDEAENLNRGMINLLQDLQTANCDLEQAEQTLRQTNSELEAFSYSVSHDLRAPLRHIDGFVKLLLKRENERLDNTSARYLETIAQSSGRMGRLIDDLLAFSRTGRVEMHLKPADSNKMIQQIVEEMSPITKGRHLVWEIGTLPKVQADGGLLRQVWQNLIGNAIKYTALRKEARIEIGLIPESAENCPDGPAFFIRDNGVGFDPQYTHKLFGVFQRLHRSDEFEGTGIGLATVRRIVHRHGGRVWAEGDVDHGATFYFTLKTTEGTE
jgi:PAS domain S-box-containing protein